MEEEGKRGQASVHNEQDKLRGIQKRSRTGRRVVCVYIQGGVERQPETERRG